jgi:hypothetical protein
MSNPFAVCFTVLLACVLVWNRPAAAQVQMREQGVKNIGSGLGFVLLCDREGLIEPGLGIKYITALKNKATKEDFARLVEQYQKTIHEKKLYSIAKDQWISFKINKADCLDVEKSAKYMIDHVLR